MVYDMFFSILNEKDEDLEEPSLDEEEDKDDAEPADNEDGDGDDADEEPEDGEEPTDDLDEPTDEEPEDDMNEEPSDDSEEPTDEESEDDMGDESGDDTSEDEASADDVEDASNESSDKLKNLQLARVYTDLYNTVVLMGDRFDQIASLDEDEDELVKKGIKFIADVKEALFDYVDVKYQTCTYEQNLFTFYQFKRTIPICIEIVKKIKDLRSNALNN